MIIVVVLAVVVALIVICGLVVSSGVLPPLLDEEGKPIAASINEKNWIKVGGIRQGFFIRGENAENPVLLYLHGGPGSPELPFVVASEKAERPEKYFTVCYWDQRGSGMTLRSKTDPATMNIDQLVTDTKEITEYLLQRFGKSKLYLAGHSWGSYLGIKTIEKYPHLYAAYIGIGQVVHQKESERLAYDYLLERARETGDTKAIKSIEAFDKTAADFPSVRYLMGPRTKYLNKYGVGMMHKNNGSMGALVKAIVLFRGYTLADKLNYFRGMLFSFSMFDYVTNSNLFETSFSFALPVYIAQGKFDYQVSYELAKQYSAAMSAPVKGFYSFEDSAHSPNMEENAKFTQVLRDVAASHPIDTK